MKAIIFTAGNGLRLRPITNNIPKPMVKVTGKPVLEHLVDHLNSFGIYEIIVNLHYKPEKIYEHFGTRLLYSYEPKILGEVQTIYNLWQWFNNEPFCVMNGDTLTNVNLRKMIAFQKKTNSSIAFMGDRDGKEICGGTWIINPYFINVDPYKANMEMKDIKCKSYHQKSAHFLDIGTPERLLKARKIYEGKT